MSLANMMHALADSLGMDLKHKGSQVYGSRELDLELIEGVPTIIKPKVVHSLVDTANRVVGLVVHVVGKLYLVTFMDADKGIVTLIVINGEALEWKQIATFENPFGSNWTRQGLYAKIVPGIEALYTRFVYEDKWQAFPKARKMIEEYLALRKEGVGSEDAFTKVAGRYGETADLDQGREVQQP